MISASGVYLIETPSGCAYVGSSRNMGVRYRQHFLKLLVGKHKNNRLQDAWDKHGVNLRMRPLLICSVANLKFYEQRAIDVLKPALNISQDACGPHVFTPEHRAKLANAKRGKVGPRLGQTLSAESRAQISSKLKGRKRSLESRQKQSASLRVDHWRKK